MRRDPREAGEAVSGVLAGQEVLVFGFNEDFDLIGSFAVVVIAGLAAVLAYGWVRGKVEGWRER